MSKAIYQNDCDCVEGSDAVDLENGCTKRVTTTCEPNGTGCPTPVTVFKVTCPDVCVDCGSSKPISMTFREACRFFKRLPLGSA